MVGRMPVPLGVWVWCGVVLFLFAGRRVRFGGTLTRRWSRRGRRRRRKTGERWADGEGGEGAGVARCVRWRGVAVSEGTLGLGARWQVMWGRCGNLLR